MPPHLHPKLKFHFLSGAFSNPAGHDVHSTSEINVLHYTKSYTKKVSLGTKLCHLPTMKPEQLTYLL
jgi:hypothetical protein